MTRYPTIFFNVKQFLDAKWSAGDVKEPTLLSQRVGREFPVLWSGLVSKLHWGHLQKFPYSLYNACVMRPGKSPSQTAV